jgi:multidrug resistance protein
MFAPGVPQVMEEFQSDNNLLASFVVSIFILGYVFGPLIVAPLAELFGRLYVYHISHILFTVFTIACAYSNSIGMLIAFRLLAGIVGSTPITIGGGSVADMFIPLERGKAMSIWSIGPLLGPVIGPIGGGFLTAARGWRSVFWFLAIAIASATAISIFVLRESYAPTLLAAKASRLRRSTENPHLVSKYLAKNPLPRSTILTRALVRPMKMLIFSPIVLSLSCYMALTYGYLYLLFTTLTDVFESVYHFKPSLVGLTYLGIGIGLIGGMTLFGMLSDRAIASASARDSSGALRPERRLLALIPAAACIPVGLLIYGWTAEKGAFWILPIIGTMIYGLGLIGTFMPIMVYLVDVFTIYAASATAANTVFRSLGGALLPLAGKPMYARLGLGWGNTLLACISMAGLPISWVFLKYGERIRLRYPVKL